MLTVISPIFSSPYSFLNCATSCWNSGTFCSITCLRSYKQKQPLVIDLYMGYVNGKLFLGFSHNLLYYHRPSVSGSSKIMQSGILSNLVENNWRRSYFECHIPCTWGWSHIPFPTFCGVTSQKKPQDKTTRIKQALIPRALQIKPKLETFHSRMYFWPRLTSIHD